MTRYRCNSCQGEYEADQPGNYYHACPDETANPRDENAHNDNRTDWEKDKVKDKVQKIKKEGRGRTELV